MDVQNDKLRLVTGRARSAAGWVNRLTRLGLVTVILAMWIEGSAVSARAQTFEAVYRDLIRSANGMADTFSTIRDAESAEAAQSRLVTQLQHFEDLVSRMAGRRISPEDRRLADQYGNQVMSAMDRMVREAERIDRDANIPSPFDLAAIRRQRDALQAALGRAGRGDDKSSFSFLLPTLLAVVFVACLACLYTEGMWGNAVRLINVVTAGLLATNFFEPVARWMESLADSYTYTLDFLALWGLFGLSMVVLRLITDFLSRVKVRFMKIVDQVGGTILACCVGWTMVCFTTMTLHTAPLAENFLFDAFQYDQPMFMGMSPDRHWLGFAETVSGGSMSPSATGGRYAFDGGTFRSEHNKRRVAFEKQIKETEKLRTLR